MLFTTKAFSSVALFLAFATVSVTASTIVAFSGSTCNGNVGNTVQCDGSCHQFSGRHSLKISGGGTHCVTYFENNSCTFQEGQGGTDIFGSGVCHNVNTGHQVGSFICAPDSVCLV